MEYIVLSLGFFLIAAIIGLFSVGKAKEYIALPIVIAIGGVCSLTLGVINITSPSVPSQVTKKVTSKATKVPIEVPVPKAKNTMIYAGFSTVIREISEDEIFKCKSYSDERLAYVVRTTSDKGLGVACLTIEVTR